MATEPRPSLLGRGISIADQNMSPAPGHATLKQVARAAGVSVSTASRGLNPVTDGRLSKDTRQRVLDAARELGYRPNPIAASLRTARTFAVGLLLPDAAEVTPLARGLLEVLEPAGYVLVVSCTGVGPSSGGALETLFARRVDGLIVPAIDADVAKLGPRLGGKALVSLSAVEPEVQCPAVFNDELAGMRLVVDHLLSLGHTHVAYLGDRPARTADRRRDAFEMATSERAEMGSTEAVASRRGLAAGGDGAAILLSRSPRATAIVAATELLAIGVLKEARARGLQVPSDLSIVGCEEIALGAALDPPLTTIRVDPADTGRAAAWLMLERISGASGLVSSIEMRPELVIRGSTGPPAGRG